MESDLTLHEVSSSDSPSAVVYLHGVNGSWRETWLNRETGFYWPEGLARAGGWSTYSIQYDAHTNWGGTTMPLQERAASIAELLRDDAQLGVGLARAAPARGGDRPGGREPRRRRNSRAPGRAATPPRAAGSPRRRSWRRGGAG